MVKADVSVVLWQGEDVVKVPLTALYRNGGDWHVFLDQNGRATPRAVTIGHRTDLEAQITDGLMPGDRVIRYPSDFVHEGARIEQR